MELTRLTLQDFRNIPTVNLTLRSPRVFFLGANGQGKTNALEAIHFLTALRSFRINDPRGLLRHGCAEAALRYEIDHDRQRETTVEIRLQPKRVVRVDGTPCRRFADLAGMFPSVACSSDEIQLIRGGPVLRRRALDLLLASADGRYYESLRRYTKTLQARNALLRNGDSSEAMLASFDHVLAPEAVALRQQRGDVLATLTPPFLQRYREIAGTDAEEPGLTYQPQGEFATTEDYLAALRERRSRELARGTTTLGPHRDDFTLTLNGHPADRFASEGQQRALILAFRIAQTLWLGEQTGVRPLFLADDILGELDPSRRERFWKLLPKAQVFATGTTPPTATSGENWQIFRVAGGRFTEEP